MATPEYRKKIIALWKMREDIANGVGGKPDRWASAEYAGRGTKSGFIQSQYHFHIEQEADRDLSDKQKEIIDKLVATWITGNPNTVPAAEEDAEFTELDYGNGVVIKATEEGWIVYINGIQAGNPLSLKEAKIVGAWLHISLEYMILAVQYAVKFRKNLPPQEEVQEAVSVEEPF